MTKYEDLTGQKFGFLTVIERAYKGHNTFWKCLCECGNFTLVTTGNLKNKTKGIKSCGCKRFSVLADRFTKNEIGNRYGRLVVIEQFRKTPKITNGRKNGNMIYCKCICDCGSEVDVWGAHLRNGSIQSCGCLQREHAGDSNRTHGLSTTKEYNCAKQRKRKELQKLHDSEWTLEMELFLRRLFDCCVVCGMTWQEHEDRYGTSLHVDHINPLKTGNGLKPGNATILCAKCNAEKQAKQLEDLPEQMRNRIIQSSELFKLLWEA